MSDEGQRSGYAVRSKCISLEKALTDGAVCPHFPRSFRAIRVNQWDLKQPWSPFVEAKRGVGWLLLSHLMLKAKQLIAVQSEVESSGEAAWTIKVCDKGVNHSFFISEIQNTGYHCNISSVIKTWLDLCDVLLETLNRCNRFWDVVTVTQ